MEVLVTSIPLFDEDGRAVSLPPPPPPISPPPTHPPPPPSHTEVLDEVTDYLGIGKYSSWSEDERCEFLAKELQGKRALIPPGMPMSDPVKEAVATFRVCAEYTDSLGAYVISMAHHASDVLAVELLQREARLVRGSGSVSNYVSNDVVRVGVQVGLMVVARVQVRVISALPPLNPSHPSHVSPPDARRGARPDHGPLPLPPRGASLRDARRPRPRARYPPQALLAGEMICYCRSMVYDG